MISRAWFCYMKRRRTKDYLQILDALDFGFIFLNTYVEGYFPKIMWTHFETVISRTNNNVEGDNFKI